MRIPVITKAVAAAFLVIFGLSVFLGAFGTVSEGEVGIKRTNGAATATLTPGLYFKVPFFQDVIPMSVRSEVFSWDKMATYSKDQQPTELKLSVQLAIASTEALSIYSKYGTSVAQRAVFPAVEKAVKEVFGQYNAVNIVQNRAKLGVDLFNAVKDEITVPGIRIEAVNLQNVDFSDAYEKSIEARMLAEVEVERLKQNREREIVNNEIAVNAAKANADAVRAKADAEAYATQRRGEAEALAITARGKALRDNPVLVELIQAEKWDGKLPVTMVPGSAVPFIGVK